MSEDRPMTLEEMQEQLHQLNQDLNTALGYKNKTRDDLLTAEFNLVTHLREQFNAMDVDAQISLLRYKMRDRVRLDDLEVLHATYSRQFRTWENKAETIKAERGNLEKLIIEKGGTSDTACADEPE